MTRFCMLPCRPDYIFPFGLGFRGRVILSSPPSRYTFRSPRTFIHHLRLGSVLTQQLSTGTAGCSTELTQFARATMANPKNGQFFTCKYCGEPFYRRASHIRRGITKSCGKRMCKSQAMTGAGNPFWGANHSEETKAQLSALKNSKPPRRYGPPKGGFAHTPEARAAISASLREQWRTNRDKRLAAIAKATETQIANRLNKQPRYRVNFTSVQREEWSDTKCAWCDATDDLVLDHIIPVMAGGLNRRANAQTLCRKCNLWKMRYVDKPFLLATLDSKGAGS